jgi:hypothetical protein
MRRELADRESPHGETSLNSILRPSMPFGHFTIPSTLILCKWGGFIRSMRIFMPKSTGILVWRKTPASLRLPDTVISFPFVSNCLGSNLFPPHLPALDSHGYGSLCIWPSQSRSRLKLA